MDAKLLRETGDLLFSKKKSLDSLWQEAAQNFYPERANFTVKLPLGTDFAASLMTSYPVLCRRDLGNQLGSMLRPTAKKWFHTARRHIEKEDNETKQWLQSFEDTQRKAMYDPVAMFTRATKEGDHDFSAFGQTSISTEINKQGNALLYRCWHLRDMAWQENETGAIGAKFRKWKPTAQTLQRLFKGKIHTDIVKQAEKTPFEELNAMHMVVEADMYDDDARGRPWWSIWYDVDHDCVIDAVPIWTGYYRIPRWQTVSDSQYSFSPAMVAALPDSRLIQAMTYTLLEAGEKATNPPMIATVDAVRSDVAVYAGGITWIDDTYDERTGEALRPIAQDFRGFNYGIAMNQNAQTMIHKAFYLDTLTMPQSGREMTAYEVGQRVQEYIRAALPIFEPMEQDYNAGICDDTFELLWRNGAFGSPSDWPSKLQGADIAFKFESPLHDAIEQQKGQILMQGEGLMASAIKLDGSVAMVIDAKVALRDALNGIGVPATWMRNEDVVDQMVKKAAEQAQAQQTLAAMQQGAGAAKDLGAAQESFAAAQSAGQQVQTREYAPA